MAQERAGLPSVSMALRETPAISMPAAFNVEQLQVPGDFGPACGQPRCPSPSIAPVQQAPLNYRTDIISSRDERWRPGTGRCATCQRLYGEQDPALCKGHGPARTASHHAARQGKQGCRQRQHPRGAGVMACPCSYLQPWKLGASSAVNPCPALLLARPHWCRQRYQTQSLCSHLQDLATQDVMPSDI